MEPHLYSWTEGEHSMINPVPATLSDSAALPQEDELTAGFAIATILTAFPESVPNLYDIKGQHFLYHLTYGQVKVKADLGLAASEPRFQVKFVPGQYSELGVNYYGKLQIGSETGMFIRLLGCGSYDPAGLTSSSIDSESLREDIAAYLLVFTCCLVKAAQYGAGEDSLDRLREVNQAIITKYFKRPLLLEWMTLQAKQVCYHRMPPTCYAEFLLQKANCGELDLMKTGQEHTKEYLERYSRWKASALPETKVYPGFQYYAVTDT